MKRLIGFSLLTLFLTGCVFRPKAPDDWYKETLQYYSEGFSGGWKNERSDLYIGDEMKDEKNKFGYLLKDLDGDGTKELLIGCMDDAAETRFTDIFIYHSDYGAFRIIHAGDGYYLYLCEDNIVREDSWYGSQTKTSYMKYLPKNNSFLIIDKEASPKKFTLTEF